MNATYLPRSRHHSDGFPYFPEFGRRSSRKRVVIPENKKIEASNAIVEDDLRELHCIENLMLSPSTPRTTMCKTPTLQPRKKKRGEEKETRRPLAQLVSPPPMQLQRPSQLQKDDKILFVPSRGLSAVQFPSLSSLDDTTAVSSPKRRRDLSQLPVPSNIRLQPRRQKRRY